jgi:hypothetical protein
MSDATSYSKLGYLMTAKESTAGTTVYPDTAHELLSESITANWDWTASGTIAGSRSKNFRPIKNRVGPFTGDISFLVEPNTIGEWLGGVLGDATDSTIDAGDSYQHDFEAENTLLTYTMDIAIANENYVHRYVGARISKLDFTINENKLQATASIMAQKAFQNARVTVAIGSGTTLTLDQTSGLTTSDTIIILDADDPSVELAELTIATVVSETVLTVSTIGVALAVDDIVVIKRQTPTYDLSDELIFSGGASAYFGAGTNAMQSISTATNVENMTVSITNDLEARWAALGTDVVDRMPSTILVKGIEVKGSFSNFHINPEHLDQLRDMEQIGTRFTFEGATIDDNSATAASASVETDGVGTVDVTVDAAGEAGNDYAILVEQGTGALSAALAGTLITVTLASVAGNNTTTLVASAIDGLSGVSSSSTGADLVTVVDNPSKIYFAGGRDAAEKAMLRFDFPDSRYESFGTNLTEDGIVNEEINFTAFRDATESREINVRLRNAVADY